MKKWNLYLVTEEKLSAGRSTLEVVREGIAGGVKVVQLRDKGLNPGARYALGREVRRLTEENGVDFIINDRVDLALALDADGVHLGQEDLPLEVARQLLGKDKIIGISVANLDEARRAETGGADYLGVGAIFSTDSKKVKKSGERIGVSVLRRIREEVRIPLVAIGGLKRDNLGEVVKAGADSIAVISALTKAENIRKEALQLENLIKGTKEERF